MKTSTKLKIAAGAFLLTGITLIILATTVFKKELTTGVNMPNFPLLIPGIFIAFLSLPMFFIGFAPNLTAVSTKLQQEALDKAGENMRQAAKQSAQIQSEAIEITAEALKKGLTDTAIICQKCKKSIDTDSQFCKYCGFLLK